MTQEEFKDGMERLRSRKLWQSSLDDSFSEVLAVKVRRFEWSAFKSAISDLLSQHNKPTVSDVVEACLRHRSKESATRSRIVLDDCRWCNRDGLVQMDGLFNPRWDSPGTAWFCCEHCANGNAQREMARFLMPVSQGVKMGGVFCRQKHQDAYAGTLLTGLAPSYVNESLRGAQGRTGGSDTEKPGGDF